MEQDINFDLLPPHVCTQVKNSQNPLTYFSTVIGKQIKGEKLYDQLKTRREKQHFKFHIHP